MYIWKKYTCPIYIYLCVKSGLTLLTESGLEQVYVYGTTIYIEQVLLCISHCIPVSRAGVTLLILPTLSLYAYTPSPEQRFGLEQVATSLVLVGT